MKKEFKTEKGKNVYLAIKIIVTIAIVAGACALIAYVVSLTFESSKAPTRLFDGEKLIIGKPFGAEISLSGATVTIETEDKQLTKRTNGYSDNGVQKGWFEQKDNSEDVYLSIMNADAKYILIINGANKYYINCDTETETDSFYAEILTHMAEPE